ncbi:S24/S26 family peptidase [Shewanella sp. UCD-KL12]|uniref:S24/S26 family peptidase n=1 Tax=Shewanella sp. UCD-KL12 TaxID=1917163 RepID=UPI000970F895|nr:S24/S26 family peptidase [Shewanella sp. UCD-KL12]
MFGINLYRVTGASMQPRIPAGSFVLCMRAYKRPTLILGAIYLFNHPKLGQLIKTLANIDSAGNLWFKGENNESISTQEIGPIKRCRVLGKVTWVISA